WLDLGAARSGVVASTSHTRNTDDRLDERKASLERTGQRLRLAADRCLATGPERRALHGTVMGRPTNGNVRRSVFSKGPGISGRRGKPRRATARLPERRPDWRRR